MYIAQGNALGYVFANNYLPKGAKALEIYAFAGYDTMGNPTWIYRKSTWNKITDDLKMNIIENYIKYLRNEK